MHEIEDEKRNLKILFMKNKTNSSFFGNGKY